MAVRFWWRMHRFYVPTACISDGRILLSQGQRKQLIQVLRMKPGDTIGVFDGSGLEYTSQLEVDDSGALSARVVESREPDTEASIRLTLIQVIPKGEKLEWILQKCTELGVAEFIIASAERSVPRISPDRISSRLERWRAIVREAAEQSGRVRLPPVEGVLTLPDALRRVQDRGRILVAWERETGTELFSILGSLTGVSEVVLLVGPEGGFTPEEVGAAIEAGAIPVSLGARILRTETAAIAASAVLIGALER